MQRSCFTQYISGCEHPIHCWCKSASPGAEVEIAHAKETQGRVMQQPWGSPSRAGVPCAGILLRLDWDLALSFQLQVPPHLLQHQAALMPMWPHEDSYLQTFTQKMIASQAINLFKKP